MDQALAVVSGRDRQTARQGMANAIVWTAVVGGAAVLVSLWLYGVAGDRPGPTGRSSTLIPNLSAAQFTYAALALPGELFFSIGLFALLGRKTVVPYSLIRVARRAILLAMIVAIAAIARLSLDVALVINLVSLVGHRDPDPVGRARATTPSGSGRRRALLAEELRFGTRSLPGSLAERLQFRGDAFLINIILGVRQTGIYSVTSGLAETLWYIPNAMGTVMFSRAVDPKLDAGRIAAVLTRTTLAVALRHGDPGLHLRPAAGPHRLRRRSSPMPAWRCG